MKLRRPTLIASLVLGAGLATGCKPPLSDVGTGPCKLVKRDPTGKNPYATVTVGEVTAGKDFISFGSTGCDDFVCVRDKDTPVSGDSTAEATGYCTHPCVVGNNNGCTASPEAMQFDSRPLTCRPMLLDPSTIAILCSTDPAKCEQLFGTNRSPFFCARSGPPVEADGGTH